MAIRFLLLRHPDHIKRLLYGQLKRMVLQYSAPVLKGVFDELQTKAEQLLAIDFNFGALFVEQEVPFATLVTCFCSLEQSSNKCASFTHLFTKRLFDMEQHALLHTLLLHKMLTPTLELIQQLKRIAYPPFDTLILDLYHQMGHSSLAVASLLQTGKVTPPELPK